MSNERRKVLGMAQVVVKRRAEVIIESGSMMDRARSTVGAHGAVAREHRRSVDFMAEGLHIAAKLR